MTFGDIYWLYAFVWAVLIFAAGAQKDKDKRLVLSVLGSLIGMTAGIIYLGENVILGLIFVFLNFALLAVEATRR